MDKLGKYKRAFLLSGIGLCLLAIFFTLRPDAEPLLVARGLATAVQPIQRGIAAATGWVGDGFSSIGDNRALIDENRQLQEEVIRLRLDNQRLQQADVENYRLNSLLAMHQQYAQLPLMAARVIGVNPSAWYSRFIIDRGSSNDVARNMAVIGNGGLLGVVRQVHPNRSQFLTVIDSDFSAAVMAVRTEDIGQIRGNIRLMQEGLTRMDHIAIEAQIMPGDEIVTSPHSSIFPPGLLVGTVESVHPNPDGLTRHAIIIPAACLFDIEMVLVVAHQFAEASETVDRHLIIYEE
ncbi:MAG: rod shape-determining protein MreC [Defluviitaleaceae bacterium]|nr:rod shape-determining protein MreC [Defluviitaleaceae bacterium]